jgi:hypothetical protein
MLNANWGGLWELERRVFWRTSATQASPSGLIDSYRARGLGPANPSGVERDSLAVEVVPVLLGEWASPTEWPEDTERRLPVEEGRGATVGGGEVKEERWPVVTALVPITSDAVEARRSCER